ncbi:MAG: cell division protein FtsX, partial [Acetobacteraceae bacterium]
MAEARLPRRGTSPRRFDELGLDRALGDRLLPLLVAAMSFLAALTLAGAIAAAAVAAHWQAGAGRTLTVQVPDPAAPAAGTTGSRTSAVLALLRSSPGVAAARQLTGAELQ